MSASSSIEWTDATWNPVHGCTRVSEGCRNCWAERITARMSKPGMWGHGFAEMTPEGPRWSGRVELVPAALEIPLRWRRPRKIFLSSFDLFHAGLGDDSIRSVFAVMAQARQHTYQILTKRPERMLTLLRSWQSAGLTLREGHGAVLPNVWLGVSVEDQKTADERVPLLMQTPAAVRFVSYEPALGPVDFADALAFVCRGCGARAGEAFLRTSPGYRGGACECGGEVARVDQIIVGGESGPGARPFDPAWMRAVVAQCRAAGVAAFCKQWGSNVFDRVVMSERGTVAGGVKGPRLSDSKGGDISEWGPGDWPREFPRTA